MTPPSARTSLAPGAFTLAEVMISMALASFILAGVMASFLFLGRSSANVQDYNDMEAQTRRMLELFAEDTRQASAITWTSSRNLTLTVNAAPVVYAYDPTRQIFYRNTAAGTQTLATHIHTFSFQAYSITGAALPLASDADLATAGVSTKQLQVSLEMARASQTTATATKNAFSARFILRNKKVTT